LTPRPIFFAARSIIRSYPKLDWAGPPNSLRLVSPQVRSLEIRLKVISVRGRTPPPSASLCFFFPSWAWSLGPFFFREFPIEKVLLGPWCFVCFTSVPFLALPARPFPGRFEPAVLSVSMFPCRFFSFPSIFPDASRSEDFFCFPFGSVPFFCLHSYDRLCWFLLLPPPGVLLVLFMATPLFSFLFNQCPPPELLPFAHAIFYSLSRPRNVIVDRCFSGLSAYPLAISAGSPPLTEHFFTFFPRSHFAPTFPQPKTPLFFFPRCCSCPNPLFPWALA